MRLEIGKRYMTANREHAKVLIDAPYDTGYDFVGVIGAGKTSRSVMWTVDGRSTYGSDNLTREMVEGVAEWNQLDPFSKNSVRRLVTAFSDQKIVGIKYLRGAHGWGLIVSKNIFEGVANNNPDFK